MIEKIIKFVYRRKALKGLIKKYRLEISVDSILKDWITFSIIDRKQENRRKELIEAQGKEKETELFYKWLKTQK